MRMVWRIHKEAGKQKHKKKNTRKNVYIHTKNVNEKERERYSYIQCKGNETDGGKECRQGGRRTWQENLVRENHRLEHSNVENSHLTYHVKVKVDGKCDVSSIVDYRIESDDFSPWLKQSKRWAR